MKAIQGPPALPPPPPPPRSPSSLILPPSLSQTISSADGTLNLSNSPLPQCPAIIPIDRGRDGDEGFLSSYSSTIFSASAFALVLVLVGYAARKPLAGVCDAISNIFKQSDIQCELLKLKSTMNSIETFLVKTSSHLDDIQKGDLITGLLNQLTNLEQKVEKQLGLCFQKKSNVSKYKDELSNFLNEGDSDGNTPLIVASLNGDAEFVQVLLHAGASKDQGNSNGATPLITASSRGHLECVKALLEANADVNAATRNGGTSSLFQAALFGHEECVVALLEANANMYQEANNGLTPLCAAFLKEEELVRTVFLKYKPQLDKKNSEGDTPLMQASRLDIAGCVTALLLAGADGTSTDSEGNTPLMIAYRGKNMECVDALIAANAAVDEPDQEGVTPLMAASILNDPDRVIALLNVGALVDKLDSEESTPLMRASYIGHIGCVNALLVGGANKYLSNPKGFTPLMLASGEGHKECVIALAGDNVDSYGDIPLIHACEGNHSSCVRALLEARANVDQLDENAITPLMKTSFGGWTDSLQVLLDFEANTELKDPDGNTPLMLASWHRNVGCVETLLRSGAKVDPVNKNDRVVFDIAYDLGVSRQNLAVMSIDEDSQIVRLLLRQMFTSAQLFGERLFTLEGIDVILGHLEDYQLQENIVWPESNYDMLESGTVNSLENLFVDKDLGQCPIILEPLKLNEEPHTVALMLDSRGYVHPYSVEGITGLLKQDQVKSSITQASSVCFFIIENDLPSHPKVILVKPPPRYVPS